jgi:hypothetical protein
MTERKYRGEPDLGELYLTGQMGGLQLDQLARFSGGIYRGREHAVVVSWRDRGYAQLGRLSEGPEWVWLTHAGMRECGLTYPATKPRVPAHTRAVTETRLAFMVTRAFYEGKASWRCERDILSVRGIGRDEHTPDGVVTWPAGTGVTWAGESWAIEVELSRKDSRRVAEIMREVLTRTGDYGCPTAEVTEPGKLPLHTRVLYLCGSKAASTVLGARDQLGALGARVEISTLPRHAPFPGTAARA